MPQATRRFQAIHTRHTDVQEHQIRKQEPRHFHCLRSISRFATQLPIFLVGDNSSDATSNSFVVVDNENAHYVVLVAAEDVSFLSYQRNRHSYVRCETVSMSPAQ